ncbi:hypothetical protein [Ramlibacter montanisoli]|uniref:Uncharacterized protein n=1 Tax=Ramlibacter montanisoli TaxID=2732512 RepID=A0A849KAU5_9BURK|nr:hypothetical protein [Ramlibacter montanisoli]NNU42165.1 hypothetical protein [Ramlibacter montanisoli]
MRAADFDEGDSSADGMERLYRLCDELHAAFAPIEAAPLLLAFAERLEDVSSPGRPVETGTQRIGAAT